MNPLKIGLVGFQGAGKDTFAEAAEGWDVLAFAEPIKRVARFFDMLETGRDDKELPRTLRLARGFEPFPEYVETLFNIQPTNKDRKAFRSALASVLQPFTMNHSLGTTNYYLSPRQFQQLIGTEIGRDLYGENFWRDRSIDIADSTGLDTLFTDVRFMNEANRMDALIYISRKGTSANLTHSSEALATVLAEHFDDSKSSPMSSLYDTITAPIPIYHFINNSPNKRGLNARVEALLAQVKKDVIDAKYSN